VHRTGHLGTKTLPATAVPCSTSDQDSEVMADATYALSRIADWVDGAQAIVDAKARLVAWLAGHDSVAPAVLKLNVCVLLVSLLRDKDFQVLHAATYALSQIARWLDGAQAILDAKALHHIS